jgi:ADP-ribose pyrophosphatase
MTTDPRPVDELAAELAATACPMDARRGAAGGRAHTHPDVLTRGVAEGWADPITDPALIDWDARQRAALIPFRVENGRPVNPCERTAVRWGRNELGHWGEQICADALVTALDHTGLRWIVMVERADGHGWALPGGYLDPGEAPARAAVRELAEETGLHLPDADWTTYPPRYVPDPRGSDESWMVTVLARADLGRVPFPVVTGADDARRAAWVRADSFAELARFLADFFRAGIFPAHIPMLRDIL